MAAGQPWSAEEDAVLRAEASTHSLPQIGAMLGRTAAAVQKRAHDLRILRGTCAPNWSDTELDRLRSCFPIMRTADLAAKLGRGVNAVSIKARSLGLRKESQYISHARANGARVTNASRPTHPFHQQRAGRFEREAGAYTPTQDAVRHLQRLAPIWRCDADGTTNPNGDHWKFSGQVMDAAAVEARATRAGWVRS